MQISAIEPKLGNFIIDFFIPLTESLNYQILRTIAMKPKLGNFMVDLFISLAESLKH